MAESCLVAIDPGENSGIAVFHFSRLVRCECGNPDTYPTLRPAPMPGPWFLQIEIPLYSDQTIGKDPQALIKLAINAGRWIEKMHAPIVRTVYPSQWKGQVPKKIHNGRVLAKLDQAELSLIPKLPETKLHNVIDAIGLGLFALGRIGRGA
jgi:hypothetical protein